MAPIYNLPMDLKVILSEMKNRIISDLISLPRAYIVIKDIDGEETTLISCSSFTISYSRESILGSFACVVEQANLWNPRMADYLNLLAPDIRKRIYIYYGQIINGSLVYVKIFTGVMDKKPETYSFNGQNTIRITGNTMGLLLQKTDGLYPGYFFGYAQDIIDYFCNEAGISTSLFYKKDYGVGGYQIDYTNALATVQAFLDVIGPAKETFFNQEGILIGRDIIDLTSNDVEFEYTASNIFDLSRTEEPLKVTTVADVTGAYSILHINQEASASLINQYGRNIFSLDSALIRRAPLPFPGAHIQKLAQDILDDGATYEFPIGVSMQLNPYLLIGSSITIKDLSLSNTTNSQIRIRELLHNFNAGSDSITRIKGYIL